MIPASFTPEIVIDHEQRLRNTEIYRARLRVLGDLSQPFSDKSDAITLRPYQVEGVKFLLRNQYAILEDEMGLGKTLQALVAAKAYRLEGMHVYVVAPVTTHQVWLREAKKVGVHIEIFSWAKIPAPLTHVPYILIADEAHYAQNGAIEEDGTDPETGRKIWRYVCKRTGEILRLAEYARAVFMLTGTPMKNGRAENLFPLLTAIRHRLSQGGDIEAVTNAYEAQFVLTNNPYRLEHLYDETKEVRLYRTKKKCLLELPDKQRILKEVELSAKVTAKFEAEFRRLEAIYHQRIADSTIGDGAEQLVIFNALRKASSTSKIEAAIEFAEYALEAGDGSLILFSEFVETADAIAEGLERHGVAYINGSTSQKERNKLVDAFQAGKHKVFIATTKTGGLGLTLHRASNVVLVDRPWTPGDAIQAEDRAHRMGQKNAVSAYWLQAHQVDKDVDAILIRKAKNIAKGSGGENVLSGIGEIMGILEGIFG